MKSESSQVFPLYSAERIYLGHISVRLGKIAYISLPQAANPVVHKAIYSKLAGCSSTFFRGIYYPVFLVI